MKEGAWGHRGESMLFILRSPILTVLQDVQIQAIQDLGSEVWSSFSADIVSRDLFFDSPKQGRQTRRGAAG